MVQSPISPAQMQWCWSVHSSVKGRCQILRGVSLIRECWVCYTSHFWILIEMTATQLSPALLNHIRMRRSRKQQHKRRPSQRRCRMQIQCSLRPLPKQALWQLPTSRPLSRSSQGRPRQPLLLPAPQVGKVFPGIIHSSSRIVVMKLACTYEAAVYSSWPVSG